VYKQREGEGVHVLAREANNTCQPEVLCLDTHLSREADVLVCAPPSAREKGSTPDKTPKRVCVRGEKDREREKAREKKREKEQPYLFAKFGGWFFCMGGAPVDVLAVDEIGAFRFDLHSKSYARYSSNA